MCTLLHLPHYPKCTLPRVPHYLVSHTAPCSILPKIYYPKQKTCTQSTTLLRVHRCPICRIISCDILPYMPYCPICRITLCSINTLFCPVLPQIYYPNKKHRPDVILCHIAMVMEKIIHVVQENNTSSQ